MRVRLHARLWGVLFAAFIALSIRTIGPALLENRIGPINPNHSTDTYLSGLTHVPNGSEPFLRIVEKLPSDKSIAILVDAGNSPSEFLGMLVAYLSWPRDVQIVKVRPSTYSDEIEALKRASASAVVFCDLEPPTWVEGATHFGSRITFVPAQFLESNR